jgi:hypothetical protein
MSFFHKKMSQNVWATIMPFGPVTLIFYWPKIFFSGQPKALISGTAYLIPLDVDVVPIKFNQFLFGE